MSRDFIKDQGFLAFGTRFRRIGEKMQSETQTLIEDEGVAVQSSHFPLLFAIDEGGNLTISALAAKLGVSQPGVTRTVGQLEKQGLVNVSQGKHDKRQREVSLTGLGKEAMAIGRDRIAPRLVRCLSQVVEGAHGTITEQLDHIETELSAKPFLDRSPNHIKGNNDD